MLLCAPGPIHVHIHTRPTPAHVTMPPSTCAVGGSTYIRCLRWHLIHSRSYAQPPSSPLTPLRLSPDLSILASNLVPILGLSHAIPFKVPTLRSSTQQLRLAPCHMRVHALITHSPRQFKICQPDENIPMSYPPHRSPFRTFWKSKPPGGLLHSCSLPSWIASEANRFNRLGFYLSPSATSGRRYRTHDSIYDVPLVSSMVIFSTVGPQIFLIMVQLFL